MRALIAALALAAVAGAASAQGSTTISGGEVRQSITPTVPANARKEAEDAVRRYLHDPDSVTFRAVRASEVASVQHGALGGPIDGPISVVCGQYSSPDRGGAYAWFFVAIKRDRVLWTASDENYGTPGEAYQSCKGAGLAEQDPATGQFH